MRNPASSNFVWVAPFDLGRFVPGKNTAGRLAGWLLLGCLFAGNAFSQDTTSLPPLRGFLEAHDPSTITPCKNRYYIFSTGQNILSKSSADKIFWTPGPAVFANPPAWTINAVPGFAGIFWAPDVVFFSNTYHLYYAVSMFGSQISAIGLVTNPTLDPADPTYKWSDQGPVITSTNGSAYNVIDPCFSWDNAGNLWMGFGSYWSGIYVVQLDTNTGLRLAPNSPTYQLAYNSSIEASYLWRRGGYYYLFVNWGSCCSGVNSTYNIRVGRSTSITGPFLDRQGVNMTSGGGTLFMRGNGKYAGPGHVGILSEGGTLWLTHHYYDGNAYAPQYGAYGNADFAMLPLNWTTDDWPAVTNNWAAVYNFQADARDDNGQYYGLLKNGAAVKTDSTYGHVLNLNGTNQYVSLPPGVGYAQTFVAVVNWRGGGAWQRIFDFGFDTSKTVMMTPASDANVLRCDINPGGNLQTIQWNQPLPTNVWTHVALTLDGSKGVLYVNGAPVVTNTSMTVLPLNVAPQTNDLGRSKFAADPYFKGQYAAFRSYGRALSAAEIAAPIPTLVQPAAGALYSPGTPLNFSGSATDFASRPLGSSNLTWQINYVQDGQTNVVFGPVAGISDGAFNVPTNATGGGTYVVILTAKDSSNRIASNSISLLPANPPNGWTSYYPLKGNASDANGHYSGTVMGGATFTNDPVRGNVLNLNGTGQFVVLPAGLSGMKTFMAWVKWNGGAAWQRIYDFGNDQNRYSVLTPLGGTGKLRFNISLNSIAGEQVLDAPAPLPSNVWTHVAVVMNGTSAVLYTNGTPVATNRFANLLVSDVNSTNNYLGKSQWPADPFFNGEVSSVRIFSRALSSPEIIGPQIDIAQPGSGTLYRPGDTINFSGGANDFSDATISATGLAWTVRFINGAITNLILGPSTGMTNGSFAIPLSGASASNGFYQVTLSVMDSAGRSAANSVTVYPDSIAAPTVWASYYPFTSGAQDSSNRYNGTLRNGASIVSDVTRGNVLNLAAASSQYVSLPVVAGTAQTVSGWVKWSGGGAWQRIFDFGQNTTQFFFLTPSDGSGLPQCAITSNNSIYNRNLEAPTGFPINQWTHVAVVLDGRQGILYLNGVAVAVNNSVNLLPSDLTTTSSSFGKSQFSSDPYFNGRLSAVRLNSTAWSPSQLFAPGPVITQPVNGSLFTGGSIINYSGTAADYSGVALSSNAFSWSGSFHSNGVTYAVFGPSNGRANGSFLVPTNAATSSNISYEIDLTVTDPNGFQQMASATVLPQTSWLTLQTVPAGLQLGLDGQFFTSPTSVVAVAGMSRTITAPPNQINGGSNYALVLWSDGGAATHSILVPITNSIFTASYVPPLIQWTSGAPGLLSLSWADWAGLLALYSTTNLQAPVVWSAVAGAIVTTNGMIYLDVISTNAQQFYRLQSP